MRLVRKDNRTKSGFQIPNGYCIYQENVFVKLGKLENREEQLGCPLEIILEAKSNGVYYKCKNGSIEKIGLPHQYEHLLIDVANKCFRLLTEPMPYSGDNWREYFSYDLEFSKYGVTWALTKEELITEVKNG